MRKVLLHISHTDIRCDSRILKELHALETFQEYDRIAIGVNLNEGAASTTQLLNARILAIRLYTKIFNFLPRAIRYGFNFIELTSILFFRGIALRPKVVHCHDTLVLPAGFLIKLFTNCKLVYDAHELESDKNGQTPLLSKGTLLIEKICWKKVDLLVSVSDSITTWYMDRLGPKERILVLNSPEIQQPNVDKSVSQSSNKYFHHLYNIPAKKLVFVYLGILGAGRGIEIILDAFADSALDAHVVFVGYGALASKIESYGKQYNNIHLHPPVPHEQVVSLVQHADFGLCFIENVSLSDYYCLPNKLFEYCFAGLPVLACDFPEIKRAVTDYALGVCCPPNIASIRSAIQSVVRAPLPRITHELHELSWPAQAVRLQHAYTRLLNSKKVFSSESPSTEKKI